MLSASCCRLIISWSCIVSHWKNRSSEHGFLTETQMIEQLSGTASHSKIVSNPCITRQKVVEMPSGAVRQPQILDPPSPSCGRYIHSTTDYLRWIPSLGPRPPGIEPVLRSLNTSVLLTELLVNTREMIWIYLMSILILSMCESALQQLNHQ